ncbi:MAG: glutamate--tRNA ligase [Gammaproteobacteria bacterium]|nr:glutamate--tRNA ligase [Gammaproteobacteria bacterium]
MNKVAVTTRFAPSPTGHTHLGNLRTALFNALLALAAGGEFLLRSEDTDRDRSAEKYLDAMCDDLRWLGLDWDLGPGMEDPAGERGPFRQSERQAIYQAWFDKLSEQRLAYPCFCSRQDLERSRKAQQRAGRAPRYAGTCRELSEQEIKERLLDDQRPTLRYRVADEGFVEFSDLAKGPQRFELADIGDFIVRRSDGTPAFFFSNALDDSLMGVTHVLRGEDHLANTPRQIVLLRSLGLEVPVYGHLSLIVGDDGKPLSKRHGTGSLKDLRELGYLPLALNNHLFRLGHASDSGDLMTLDEMTGHFDCAHLGRAPARHDPVQLDHWQKLAVMKLSDEEIKTWLGADADGGYLGGMVPADQEQDFIGLVRDNLQRPSQAVAWAKILFADEPISGEMISAGLSHIEAGFFEDAAGLWSKGHSSFRDFSGQLSEKTKHKGKKLFMPLRVALTGELHGPELEKIAALMGKDRVERRFLEAAERC